MSCNCRKQIRIVAPDFSQLDFSTLTPEQIQQLCDVIAANCAATPILDATFTKSVENALIQEGAPIVYNFELCNTGNVEITSAPVTDSLGIVVNFNLPLAPGACDTQTGIYFATTDNESSGEIANTASVEVNDAAAIGPLNLTSDAFLAAPVLEITKTASVTEAVLGDPVEFTIELTNTGGEGAPITVNDLLPADFEFVSATTSSGTYDDATGEWSIPAVGATETLTLTTTALVANASSLQAGNIGGANADLESFGETAGVQFTPSARVVVNEITSWWRVIPGSVDNVGLRIYQGDVTGQVVGTADEVYTITGGETRYSYKFDPGVILEAGQPYLIRPYSTTDTPFPASFVFRMDLPGDVGFAQGVLAFPQTEFSADIEIYYDRAEPANANTATETFTDNFATAAVDIDYAPQTDLAGRLVVGGFKVPPTEIFTPTGVANRTDNGNVDFSLAFNNLDHTIINGPADFNLAFTNPAGFQFGQSQLWDLNLPADTVAFQFDISETHISNGLGFGLAVFDPATLLTVPTVQGFAGNSGLSAVRVPNGGTTSDVRFEVPDGVDPTTLQLITFNMGRSIVDPSLDEATFSNTVAEFATVLAAGELIDFEFEVCNKGLTDITSVTLTNSLGLAVPNFTLPIAPASCDTQTATYTITAADVTAGQVVMNASVDLDNAAGDGVLTVQSQPAAGDPIGDTVIP